MTVENKEYLANGESGLVMALSERFPILFGASVLLLAVIVLSVANALLGGV